MIFYIRRAIRDILENRFLNLITIATIALSVLIVSAFLLFFVNGRDLFDAWKKGVRMMVYLEPGTSENQRSDVYDRLQAIAGIRKIRFVPKNEALELLKERMQPQHSLLDNLRENPLPDAFDVTLAGDVTSPEKMTLLAQRIQGLGPVSDVQYGRQWIERFANFFNLFTVAGYGLGVLFFSATSLIAGNTIRLVLYARKEEIHILRLVGATDNFIQIPFYLVALIQGLIGGGLGVGVLYVAVTVVASRFEQVLAAEMMSIRFFTPTVCAAIVGCGMLTGLLGCFFSLKQFLQEK